MAQKKEYSEMNDMANWPKTTWEKAQKSREEHMKKLVDIDYIIANYPEAVLWARAQAVEMYGTT